MNNTKYFGESGVTWGEKKGKEEKRREEKERGGKMSEGGTMACCSYILFEKNRTRL